MHRTSAGPRTYPHGDPLRCDGQDRNGPGTQALEDAGRHRAQQQAVSEPDRQKPAQVSASVRVIEVLPHTVSMHGGNIAHLLRSHVRAFLTGLELPSRQAEQEAGETCREPRA